MADASVWADIKYFCFTKGLCANAPPKHRSRFGYVLSMVPLFYKSVKFIKVDEPAVVIGCRSLQLTALVVSLLPLYFGDAWAIAESAGGTVNAWAEAGGLLTAQNSTAPLYCSNAGYSYSVGNRDFLSPACRTLMPVELSERSALPPSVFYTTAFVETVTRKGSHSARALTPFPLVRSAH